MLVNFLVNFQNVSKPCVGFGIFFLWITVWVLVFVKPKRARHLLISRIFIGLWTFSPTQTTSPITLYCNSDR